MEKPLRHGSLITDKPYGVILDTNVLIYLFQPEIIKTELFNHLLSCVLFRSVELIIPAQVKKEWDKHKIHRNEEYLTAAQKAIEKHIKLADHIQNVKERERFIEQIAQLKKMAIRNYTYTFGFRARNLDKLIHDTAHTVIPDRCNSVEKRVVDMALNKIPPFFGSDNNEDSKKCEMADAVIFFTAYEYAKKYLDRYEKVYFVSVNKKDFCAPGNAAKLHNNLQPYADELGIIFSNDIGRLLNEIDPDKLQYNEFMTDDINLYLTDNYFESCPQCEEDVHINADVETVRTNHRPQGVYHLRCPHCKHIWSTGTSYEDYIY